MRSRIFLWVMLVMFFSGCQQYDGKVFKSQKGGFSIQFPDTPTEEVSISRTPLGDIDLHLFTLEKKLVIFLVGYSDYPAQFVKENSNDSLLNIACAGAIANYKGIVFSNEKISLGIHPGREIVVKSKDDMITYLTRLFLVENRLYQVTVLALEGKTIEKSDKNFIESFKLITR